MLWKNCFIYGPQPSRMQKCFLNGATMWRLAACRVLPRRFRGRGIWNGSTKRCPAVFQDATCTSSNFLEEILWERCVRTSALMDSRKFLIPYLPHGAVKG